MQFSKYLLKTVVAAMALLANAEAFAQERITLEDKSVLNVFITESMATGSDPRPLVILMGGGPGNLSISRDTSRWLGSEFASRGWFVAVPVSPNNRAFRGAENNQKITYLINELRKRDGVSSGKVLLAGISNGGISALEIARSAPKDFFGVVAVPALTTSAFDNRDLRDFPVYLRIGGYDELGWADRFEGVVEALREAGVVLDAAIIDGAPHMFRMHWPSLDAWLQRHVN